MLPTRLMLVSLHLSVAFDTINHHSILLIQPYLVSLHLFPLVSSNYVYFRSPPRISPWAAAILSTYTLPIAMIICPFHVCHQQYTDDTQLFIALNPSDPSSDIKKPISYLVALQSWFCLNGTALNTDKSDAMLLGTHQRSSCYTSLGSIDVAGCSIPLFHHIKVLHVTLDNHLSWTSTLAPSSSLHSIIFGPCSIFARHHQTYG